MKRKILLIAAFFIMGAFITKTMAQATVTGTTAGVKIITPITLTQTANMHFGTMAVLVATSGTCILSTANVRTATGGVNLSAASPTSTNAAYNVGGFASTNYAITLPATITVTDGASHNMTIGTLLAHTASAGVDGLTGTLTSGGTDSFTVGGTLSVAAAQVAGTYTGTFSVTVAYN